MSAADATPPPQHGTGPVKAAGKALHSSRLAGMAFMQRAAQRKQLQQRKQHAEEAEDGEHWVLPQATSGAAGCLVVVEGDPPPASPLGRISFKGFNPATDKLREEREEAAAARLQRRGDGADTSVTVSDADMAAHLGPQAHAQNLGDAGPAVASPSTSRPDGAHAAGTAGEAGGKKRKKRRREGAAAEGAAGASPEGRSHDAAGAAGFRAPSSLAAGNPFAALMREPTTARKKA